GSGAHSCGRTPSVRYSVLRSPTPPGFRPCHGRPGAVPRWSRLGELAVRDRVEEGVERGTVRQLDLADPPLAVGVLIEAFGRVDQGGVHLDHRAGHRRVELGD